MPSLGMQDTNISLASASSPPAVSETIIFPEQNHPYGRRWVPRLVTGCQNLQQHANKRDTNNGK